MAVITINLILGIDYRDTSILKPLPKGGEKAS